MAGIGFQLHKLLEDESFLQKAKAYIFASIITSGPWILSIISLALLGILSGKFLAEGKFYIISITIVYTFAFSLILTGPVQFNLTRYLADQEYIKRKDKMLSALITALLLSLFISLLFAVPWYVYNQGSLVYKITGISLFVVISSIWTMMDFLSCLKKFQKIIIAFFVGSFLSVFLATVLGIYYETEGALIGFTSGQLFIFLFLIYGIKAEFSFNGILNLDFFKYFRLFPYIFLTGLFYNLGLWSDKILGWVVYGKIVFGNFKAYNIYDTPIFIAYLSIIPSLAYFLIQSETNFFLAHRKFFDSINKESLNNILQYKDDLIKTLKKSLLKLFAIQLITSLTGSLAAGIIGTWMGLVPKSILIMRILFFAAGFQVLFLYIIIFMMYFDLSATSFYLVFMFFLTNLGFNIFLTLYPQIPMGVGYCASILLSLATGLAVLLASVGDIEYKIFMRQED